MAALVPEVIATWAAEALVLDCLRQVVHVIGSTADGFVCGVHGRQDGPPCCHVAAYQELLAVRAPEEMIK